MKFFLSLGVLLASSLSLAFGPGSDDRSVLHIPRPSNLGFFMADDARRDVSNDAPYRFALGYKVNSTALEQGVWDVAPNGENVWRLKVDSDGATSLNIGFSEFHMPPSGRLVISSGNGKTVLRPFTAADNEWHNQLWTPPVDGTAVNLEIRVAAAERNMVRLRIGVVNYGYRDYQRRDAIALSASGSCNIDVACNREPAWNDPVRAVGAITVGGTDTCTGFLVNNTAQDRRMFFMTANHCRINSGNAASVVAIWNYQNSTCRPPNSSQSGRSGDGKRDQFNSGAIFRASNAASDFTLVELDDPMDPKFNLYFAGWDHSGAESPTLVGIHHPAVSEKRISMSTLPSTTTTYLKEEVPGDGTHIRVNHWTNGTTEPGSSGSPLFDAKMRVIGQLHGGYASCSSITSDWYGRFSKSWEGGGTPATRLKDWLDPRNSGVMALDGLNGSSRFIH